MLAMVEAGFSLRLRSRLIGLSVSPTVRAGVPSTPVGGEVLQGQRRSPRGKRGVLWHWRLGSWHLGSGFALHHRSPAFCRENAAPLRRISGKSAPRPGAGLLYTRFSSQPHCLSLSQRAWRQIRFPPFSLAIIIKVKSIRVSFCPNSVNLFKCRSAPAFC